MVLAIALSAGISLAALSAKFATATGRRSRSWPRAFYTPIALACTHTHMHKFVWLRLAIENAEYLGRSTDSD